MEYLEGECKDCEWNDKCKFTAVKYKSNMWLCKNHLRMLQKLKKRNKRIFGV